MGSPPQSPINIVSDQVCSLEPPMATSALQIKKLDDPPPIVGFEKPLCLVENVEGGKLKANEDTLEILCRIRGKITSVSIVGPYRTGKSFLMNRLMGRNYGFDIGYTIQAKTKGIWVWCRQHPKNTDECIVLLDTEGLGDVNKGDKTNDDWICSLAILLSCTFVYNNTTSLDSNSIERLHDDLKLANLVQSHSTSQEDGQGQSITHHVDRPSFVWAVRDFTLELEIDGKSVTADEYMQNAFTKKREHDAADVSSDTTRQRKYITDFFREMKCFVFPRAATAKKLKQLESLPDSDLDPEFLEAANKFCEYIYSNASPMTIMGQHLTGNSFSTLLRIYVESINSGKVPQMKDAVTRLTDSENRKAVDEGMEEYMKIVTMVTLPMKTANELYTIHKSCESAALKVFQSRIFDDRNGEFEQALEEKIHQEYECLWQNNKQISRKMCVDALTTVAAELKEKVEKKTYIKAGGHKEYVTDKMAAIARYQTQTKDQLMTKDVLEEFINKTETEAEMICLSDFAIQNKEDEAAVQRRLREMNELRAKLAREKTNQVESDRAELLVRHKAYLQQMEDQWEKERTVMKANLQQELDDKVKERRDALEQEHSDQLQTLQDEEDALKGRIAEISSQSTKDVCRMGLKTAGLAGVLALTFVGGWSAILASGVISVVSQLI